MKQHHLDEPIPPEIRTLEVPGHIPEEDYGPSQHAAMRREATTRFPHARTLITSERLTRAWSRFKASSRCVPMPTMVFDGASREWKRPLRRQAPCTQPSDACTINRGLADTLSLFRMRRRFTSVDDDDPLIMEEPSIATSMEEPSPSPEMALPTDTAEAQVPRITHKATVVVRAAGYGFNEGRDSRDMDGQAEELIRDLFVAFDAEQQA